MTEEIAGAVVEGNVYDIADIVEKHLEAGEAPMACLEAMMAGLDETGKLFERGEYFVPELMMAANTYNAGMEVLAPHLAGESREFRGTVVLGTVEGDVHDIGKNLVGFMLECSGFSVIDLGTDVSTADFVEAVETNHADVVAMSALLTTTMLSMPGVVKALEDAGLREKVKVIIGGAPVSQKFAEDIDADAYAASAPAGVHVVKGWLAG
ncbi:MAG: cobalamin-dependent protein [Chloroflexota bacterium]|nr:cobalamin-dependent protein [Chloroflexota bacterium]